MLDKTPFYAEAGGQLADTGKIIFPEGVVEVYDVQKPMEGLIVHKGNLVEGKISLSDMGIASIDKVRRTAIARAHTSTHIIHKALQEELGKDATQAGSENSPNRVRFDFRRSEAVPEKSLEAIEQRVNEKVRENLMVTDKVMPIQTAKDEGAMALFGEKYGDEVRVVSIGDSGWSKELCVGTHVKQSNDIGSVTLLGVSALGAGVRRVDALVAKDAIDHQAKQRAILHQLTGILDVPDDQMVDRISQMMQKIKAQEKEINTLTKNSLQSEIPAILSKKESVGEVDFIYHNAPSADASALRELSQTLKEKLKDSNASVVVLSNAESGKATKVSIIAISNENAQKKGILAGDLVKVASKILGGGGGGKPDLAQGGGSDSSRLQEAISAIKHQIIAKKPY
jgi:alanyl-tRNA synthetase